MTLKKLLIIAISFLFSVQAFALDKKTICTWDPVGQNGPVMTFYSDLKPKAIAWGLDLNFVAYTDEKVAANDFKAGVCEGVLVTAILGRQFVPFGGTLDAIGGITSEEGLAQILSTLANPKAADLMINGEYETVGSFPVGTLFAFVNDKSINTVAKMSGKKISVLNEDQQTLKLTNMVGGSPVGTSLATFSGQFNNGNIDIVFMPALAYNTFELYHGLGEKGGIIDHRFFYGMLQTITKRALWPEDFGTKMRGYVLGRLNDINKMVADAEKEIPAKYWIQATPEVKAEFVKLSRDVRLALKEEGKMDPKALKLLWKIRCSQDQAAAECSTPE